MKNVGLHGRLKIGRGCPIHISNYRKLSTLKRSNALEIRICQQAKIDRWRVFVTSVNSDTGSPKVWNTIRKLKGQNADNEPLVCAACHSLLDQANTLATHFE